MSEKAEGAPPADGPEYPQYVLHTANCLRSYIVELYFAVRKLKVDKSPKRVNMPLMESKFDPFVGLSHGSGKPPVLEVQMSAEEKITLSTPWPILDFLERSREEKIAPMYLQLQSFLSTRLIPSLEAWVHSMSGGDQKAKFRAFEVVLSMLECLEEHYLPYLLKVQAREKKNNDGESKDGAPDVMLCLPTIIVGPMLLILANGFKVDFSLFRLTQLESYVKYLQGHPSQDLKWVRDISTDPKKSGKFSRVFGMHAFQDTFVAEGYGREEIGASVVVPQKYTVHLRPNSDDFVLKHPKVEDHTPDFGFSGEMTMDFDVKKPTRIITLNANDIEVQEAYLLRHGPEERKVPFALIGTNKKLQRVSFVLAPDQQLSAGESCSLVCKFTGVVNDKMTGLYRSRYVLDSGMEKWMAITQFEAVGARLAFPCVDEPAVKAIFELSLTIPKGFVALSNMPEVERKEVGGRFRVQFAPSVKMSTYLYAMCIVDSKDYGCVEGVVQGKEDPDRKIKVRVWSRKPEEGEFALECAVKSLPLYEKYFEELFPLPKCDIVAVSEFAAGAMENWGLITFRETAVLLAKTSSAAMRQRVAIVVIHELAHQWFGNLVTMEWWIDLWLNEGFATWCEYFICDQIYPEMQVWRSFVTHDFVSALSLDSLESSHAVEVHVTKAAQIDEIFDTISYQKGCCVVRMAVEFLGIETFRKGICAYLREFKYGNATTRDLWRHLSEASGKDVSTLMAYWTGETGYPYVVVKKGAKEGTLELEQKRYLVSGKELPEDASRVWPIPLSYITNLGSEEHKVLMNSKTLSLVVPEGAKWVKFNPGCKGFYRVLYADEDLFGSLQKNVEDLPQLDRFSLLTDITAFVKSGLVESHVALGLIGALKNEETYVVVDGMVSQLGSLRALVKYDPDNLKLFNVFSRGVLEKMKKIIGKWEGGETDHLRIMLQQLIVGALCAYEDPDIIAQAKAHFDEDVEMPKVANDLKGTALATVIKTGGRAAFDKLRSFFEECKSNEIQVRCLRALGRSADTAIAQEALDYMYTDKVKQQDKIYLWASVAYNPKARELVWRNFVENWAKLREMYEGSMLLRYFIQLSCGIWDTEERAKMVEKFFEENPFPSAAMTIHQSLEAVRTRAAFVAREKDKLVAWLKANVKVPE